MFKKNFILKRILFFVLLVVATVYIINSYNRFNSTLVGSNIEDVKKSWGEPYFQSTSKGKIHQHYRSLFIYKCVFIYNENDSILIEKWKQID
ncbi:hypothetical protein SAMN05421741_14910 [Paenimyroides ummariense]|uniref:Uncharacterized protein n=1 Tax=Paenimyroides ummariense TaxID=913024 RepID=A0A1I5GT40_9FLAO|nr:hypothetical protein SAMN05421741_14910 [Paenimyroides ummariense]